MKKILYINYMKQFGHINFDMIHINAMLSQGYDVKVIMHSEIAEKMSLSKDKYAIILPKWLGFECKNSFINRLFYIFTLLYIKMHLVFAHYDYYIISNIDELTLGLLPITNKMYMICHGSCRGFENRIKRFFLERLSKKNTFIVFNEEMAKPFKNNGIQKVKVTSHGCIAPFAITNMISPTYIEGYAHIIFHASPKTDHNFIKEVYNEKYNNLLKENGTLLLLRNNPYEEQEMSNIKFINCHLTKEEYQTIFLRSDIILFAYPKSFYLQVSGVSFECVANKKKILALRHSSLKYMKNFCNYDPFFSCADEMINKTKMITNDKSAKIIVTPKELTPNYSMIFN